MASHQGGVQFLFNSSSFRFLAHEARLRERFWKNARGVFDETNNANKP